MLEAQTKQDAELGCGEPPVLSRFCPRDEYLSTFDMLQDGSRNRAYKRAVNQLVHEPANKSTDAAVRWLDIGTGSGLLASLVAAASSTASTKTEVFACEAVEEVANVAARTFDNNETCVHLFRGHSTQVKVGRDLPSRVPRVISELLGTGLLDEGVIPTMRDAKNRLLEPGFVSIPSSAEVWAFCCESDEVERMSQLSKTTPRQFCVPSSERWKHCPGTAAPASLHVRAPRWGGVGFRPLSSSVKVFYFDFADLPGSAGRERGVRFPIETAGTINALVCWWRCFMDRDGAIVLSTRALPEGGSAEIPRDHWRQSVYSLPMPVAVEAGDVVRTVARHDDITVWFEGFSVRESNRPELTRPALAPSPAPPVSELYSEPGAQGGNTPFGESAGTGTVRELASPCPPVCVCGLHRTCQPLRIWMLNDEGRNAAFQSAIRAVLHRPDGGRESRKRPRHGEGGELRKAHHAVCACISDGFLLQLLAAGEGASDVLEISPSATLGALCRDMYRANNIEDGKIRPFPGGVASFYDLLSPPPGSPDVFAETGKLDAVIGEPFFNDLSNAWPLESLLLFWCVRTALEGGGCFSPRTRVIPARARLMACPFASDLLFRGRRRVGTVEGVDMSAVNDGLGYESGREEKGKKGGAAVERKAGGSEGNMAAVDIESVRLSEYPHVLLGPPTAVLDMDLARPLCDLDGGRTKTRCGSYFESKGLDVGDNCRSVCHGLALWLNIWLDDEGHHRLSTGPEVPYWAQGLLFFEDGWSVPPCGRSFHVEAVLKDGALKVDVS